MTTLKAWTYYECPYSISFIIVVQPKHLYEHGDLRRMFYIYTKYNSYGYPYITIYLYLRKPIESTLWIKVTLFMV